MLGQRTSHICFLLLVVDKFLVELAASSLELLVADASQASKQAWDLCNTRERGAGVAAAALILAKAAGCWDDAIAATLLEDAEQLLVAGVVHAKRHTARLLLLEAAANSRALGSTTLGELAVG